MAIIGQSGSGKSTLMNMLGCLDVPTSGKYYLNGKDVSKLTDDEQSDIRNLEIGFIFQGFNLISNLTAIENVELPLIYRSWWGFASTRPTGPMKCPADSSRGWPLPERLQQSLR